MYDMPEVQHLNDILFKYLHRELHHLYFQLDSSKYRILLTAALDKMNETVVSNPDCKSSVQSLEADLQKKEKRLHRPSNQSTVETENVWSSATMFFSQICGFPFSTNPAYQHLCLLGTPSYDVDGCQPGLYRSFIIVKKSKAHVYDSVTSLAGASLAINHATSYSGSIAMKRALFDHEIFQKMYQTHGQEAGVARRNVFQPNVLVTGSHREAVRAVATRADVDCAAIDCVTFALLPSAEKEHVTIIGRTKLAPSPPFVCAHEAFRPVLNDVLDSVLNGRPRCVTTLDELVELQRALIGLKINGYQQSHVGKSTYSAHFVELSKELSAFAAFEVHDDRDFFSAHDACGYHFDHSSSSLNMSKRHMQWFDRGMLLAYNFNHEEAQYCFEQILKDDPQCGIANWGMVYTSGVYYNRLQCEVVDMERACAHAQTASSDESSSSSSSSSSSEEKNNTLHFWLMFAVQARAISNYGPSDSEKQQQIRASNVLYACRMKQVHDKFPTNADVSALFAEALMNLRPWKLWPVPSAPMSTPIAPDTLEIQRVLELAMACSTPHPGLAHFYVHLMELAPKKSMKKKAVSQSNLLRSQWPACGHLLHMASHIDMQFGQYERSIQCNWAGIQQDKLYAQLRGSDNYYHGNRIHNHHMLVWSAMFAGKFTLAMAVAEEARKCTPPAMLQEYIEYMEPYLSDMWMILIRFGKWEEILTRPFLDDKNIFPVWYAWDCYAKALALSALGKISEAEVAAVRYKTAVSHIPSSRYLHNVKSSRMFAIASEVLAGELDYRRGHVDSAFAHLRVGVELDDALPYDEPWGWTVPVRHALGALLFEAGGSERVEAAAQVYKKDLDKYPGNVWSLVGLKACYEYKKEIFPLTLLNALQTSLFGCEEPERMRYSCFCAGQRETTAVEDVQEGSSTCGCGTKK